MQIGECQDPSRVLNSLVFAKFAVRGTGVRGWIRDRPLHCAALSTACCRMLVCLPQNEPFPQEEAWIYEYTAERSDWPIRPSLSELSTPQHCCYCTTIGIYSKTLHTHRRENVLHHPDVMGCM